MGPWTQPRPTKNRNSTERGASITVVTWSTNLHKSPGIRRTYRTVTVIVIILLGDVGLITRTYNPHRHYTTCPFRGPGSNVNVHLKSNTPSPTLQSGLESWDMPYKSMGSTI